MSQRERETHTHTKTYRETARDRDRDRDRQMDREREGGGRETYKGIERNRCRHLWLGVNLAVPVSIRFFFCRLSIKRWVVPGLLLAVRSSLEGRATCYRLLGFKFFFV